MLDHTELLVVGECVADIVRLPDQEDRVHPGGSPANVAYGLARLGHRPTLLTQLGPDPNGRLIRDHLASAGVTLRTDGAPAPTPSAAVTLDGAGQASYAFDIAWTLARSPWNPRRAMCTPGRSARWWSRARPRSSTSCAPPAPPRPSATTPMCGPPSWATTRRPCAGSRSASR